MTSTSAQVAAWRLANPELYKAQLARKRTRIKNDPVRYAHYRAMENANRRSKTKRGQIFTTSCKRCKEEFAYIFVQRHRNLCDLCKKHTSDWKNYGLTGPEASGFRAKAQCEICGRKDNPGGPHNSWQIDHCHDSGRIRGLLCAPCNTVLGLMGNDPGRLRAAAEYLSQ